jgi:hypothetical protein
MPQGNPQAYAQGGGGGTKAKNPLQLPAVKKCVARSLKGSKDKEKVRQEAKRCVQKLMRAGVIARDQQGNYVQRKQQRSKGAQ